MRTTFGVKQPYADIFLDCAKRMAVDSPVRPIRFMEKMEKNQGSIGVISGFGCDADGLERRNPLIVALGDSVTAGHFESLLPDSQEAAQAFFEACQKNGRPPHPIEITDARECYLEKFRQLLIDKYEQTSVSVINAGIAGDHLISMAARAGRDVICHNPDLVLINGALNWHPQLGTTAEYKEILRSLVRRIASETDADIILMTPNGDLPNPMGAPQGVPVHQTHERVVVIRQLAEEENVCLADTYGVWEAARAAGCPWEALLANGINHPAALGHQVYAMVLMKLFS